MSAQVKAVRSRPTPPAPVLVTERDLPRVLAQVVVGVTLTMMLAVYASDYLVPDGEDEAFDYPLLAGLLFTYKVLLYLTRFQAHGTYVLYDALWGCNVGLDLMIVALLRGTPFLIGIAMTIVSGDQILWFVDVISYMLTGKFHAGAMKYLTYPENRSFSKRFFASHHLWFLPLSFWLLRDHGGMHVYSFLGCAVVISFLSCYCRAVVPFQVKAPGEEKPIYLNINLCYEFWKDIPIPFVDLFNQRHAFIYMPFIIVVGNLVATGLPHLILLGISKTLQ